MAYGVIGGRVERLPDEENPCYGALNIDGPPRGDITSG